MEENISTELEEGEAGCYREEDEDANNIDPDTAFSYLDGRIQKFLGHFQKDFEGEVSAENLGAKFGGYGSFLPTYERSAFPRQRSPVKSSLTLKSPNSVPVEGTLQNVQAPAIVPPSSKPQNANHSMESLHSAKLHSGDVKHIKQESSLCTSSVVGCPVENGANKAENKTNRRSLKFRIKVVPDIKTEKNVALYDGLGLVGSPSTSFGSSSEESEGQPSLSGEAINLSSAEILRVMTSFPVPAGELISPLHDSLLSLVNKEPLPMESRPAQDMKVSLASARPANQSVNKSGTIKMTKQKKLKSVNQHKRLTEVHYGNGTNVDSKMLSSPVKKKIKNELLESEGSQQAVASTSEVSVGACRVNGRSTAVSNVVKESNPGRDGGTKMQNGRKSFTVRAGELTPLSTDFDPLFDFNDKVKVEKSSLLSQDTKQLFKCEGDVSITEEYPQRRKVGQFCGHNGTEEKHITGGRKLKGIVFDAKEAVRPTKVRLTGCQVLGAKDMKRSSLDVYPPRNNVRIKSKKQSTRHTYDHTDAHASSSRELKCPEVPSKGKRKSLSSNNGDTGDAAAMDCSKERNTFLSGTTLEDVPNAVPKTFMPESTQAMETAGTEFWVCCDNCEKWRVLPFGRTGANLPKEWLCEMLDWLPEKITCETSEDKTNDATKALSASQFQSHANGSISGVNSSDIQYLSQNAHSFSNHSPDNKLSSKDGLGSGKGNFLSLNKNNTKTSLQESSKSRSLSSIIPPPTKSHSWKKAESADPAKSLILISQRKGRTLTKGDHKLFLKVRGGRVSNEDGAETSKRVKIDENKSGLSAQRKVKISSKYLGAEVHPPKDQKIGGMDRLVVSLKNLGGRAPAQAPADYASSDMKKSNKGSSSKKRKLKDSQKILSDGGAEHLSTKKKKFRALDITSNEISNKNGDDGTEEVSTLRDFSSGFVIAQTDVLDGMSTGMDRRRKHQKMLGTQQPLDHVELMRGDTGHGRIPLAATSSSSKVSSSHKMRAKYEVKGSPVQSVSSSPLRVKLTDAGSRFPRHGDTKTGFASVMGNARNISAKKINWVSKLSRVASKEKLSSDFLQESLKCDPADRNAAEPPAESANGHSFIGTAGLLGNGELSADTCVDHSAGESRAHMKNRASALLHIQSDDVSKQRSKDRDECPKPDFGILGEKAQETAMEERFESELRTEHAPPHSYTLTFTNVADVADKNDKNCGGRRESLGHSLNDGRVNKLAKESHYLQDCSLNKLSHESEGQTRAASVSGDSRIRKSILALNPQDGAKEGISNRASGRAFSQVSACRVNLVDVSANGNVSKEVIMNKNGASNSLDCFALDRHEYKDVIASSPARVNLSNQTVDDVLKKAKYLRDQADRLKNCGFSSESSGTCLQAALMFLLGASLLEKCGGENGKQTPLQVYGVTAKLFQLCATEFEGHKEMAAAALAYKCMEVAFMKVVSWEDASRSRDLHEVQAALLQGESPSSSASDVDNLNNQAVVDRPSLPKGAAPQVFGSNIIVGRNRPCFARLLDFTQDVSLAMEASKKCRICFIAAIAGTEKSKNSNPMASLKTVIDFNFQDIERLIPLVREAIDRLGLSGAKE